MTKQHFIALADIIREHNRLIALDSARFGGAQIETLANFCKSQNPSFNRSRWKSYVNGENKN